MKQIYRYCYVGEKTNVNLRLSDTNGEGKNANNRNSNITVTRTWIWAVKWHLRLNGTDFFRDFEHHPFASFKYADNIVSTLQLAINRISILYFSSAFTSHIHILYIIRIFPSFVKIYVLLFGIFIYLFTLCGNLPNLLFEIDDFLEI